MKVVALIPARYASDRFPGKLLKDLNGKSVILRTYEAAVNSRLFQEVYVITDHQDIFNEIQNSGGKALMSRKNHPSGTDRIAEFAPNIDADIFINIQGDEPFIDPEQLASLIEVFKNDTSSAIDIASLMIKIKDENQFNNPNNVKVVFDKNNFALYFSRAPIPYPRNNRFQGAYKHIGVYAFKKSALIKIAQLQESTLEKIEKLENLRFLENGFSIKMVATDHINFGIDTQDDLQEAIEFLKNKKND